MGIDFANTIFTILISVLCGLYSGVIVARRSTFDQIKTDIVSGLQKFYQSKIRPDDIEVLFIKFTEAENKFRYLGHFEAIRDLRSIQAEIRKSLDKPNKTTGKEAAIHAWNEMATTVEMGINIRSSIFTLYLPFPYRKFLRSCNRIKNHKSIK